MASVDLSLIKDFIPIFSFLLVFTVMFAILAKSKILGESKFVNLFVSFIIATMFVSLTKATDYVLSITPWFVVFILISFFIFILVGFTGKVPEGLTKGIGVVVVLAMIIVFLVSAYFTFSSEPLVEMIRDWITKPRIYGTLMLVLLGALVSWVLIRAK